MTYEERLLAIELERLEMEKQRDRHASLRFIIGSVLLALGTSGASMYVSAKQEARSIVASERQWVIPILLNLTDEEYDARMQKIDSLLKLTLSEQTMSYLQAEREATLSEKTTLEETRKAEQEALLAAEAKAKEAVLAKLKEEEAAQELAAKKLAQQDEREKAEVSAKRAKENRISAEKAAKDAAERAVRKKSERETLARNLDEARIKRFRVY